jgi:hypothetical protein
MEGYGAPSRPVPISPQSSHEYDLAKAALLAIFGVVITVFFKKLANYFMRNQQVAAETAGPSTVQLPRLPPEDPEEIGLKLSVVLPACNRPAKQPSAAATSLPFSYCLISMNIYCLNNVFSS